jgi:hypothetical protein
MARVEILSGIERRRRWSVEEKRRLVAGLLSWSRGVGSRAAGRPSSETSFTDGARSWDLRRVSLKL